MTNSTVTAVFAAYTECGAYGLGKTLPWPSGSLPGDLPRFKKITTTEHMNVLICGKTTAMSMGNVVLGDKRILIGVSSSVKDYGGGYGHGRHYAQNFEEAHKLALTFNPHRIFYIGGESAWLHGAEIADEMFLTIVGRRCDDGGTTRLKTPLHLIAQDNGMRLEEREARQNKGEGAWVRNYNFERWSQPKEQN